jgi:hypothetical protein
MGEGFRQNSLSCKLKKLDDGVYVAVAGSGIMASLFYSYSERYSLQEIRYSMELCDYFSEFLDWCCKYFGSEDEANETFESSQFLLLIGRKVWFFSNYFVKEIAPGEFQAIGNPIEAASACMLLGVTVEEALKATCRVNIYCSEPLHIIEIDL